MTSQSYVQSDAPLPYALQGIVIHMGTSDSGHYYSFIQDDPQISQKWYKFNDEFVTESSEYMISEMCNGQDVSDYGSHSLRLL